MARFRDEYGTLSEWLKKQQTTSRVKILCEWTHNLWDHKGDCQPEPNDPLLILQKSKTGAKYSCREYAYVLAGALVSIGIKARTVELMPMDIDTRPAGSFHVVVEAFLRDKKKWVMVDPQWNAIPFLKDYPLSLVELQPAIAKGYSGLKFVGIHDLDADIYRKQLGPYLYFMYVQMDNRVAGTQIPHKIAGGLLRTLRVFDPKVFRYCAQEQSSSYGATN